MSNSTYVHPVWLAPAESLPPVTSYEVIICEDAACNDADNNVPPTRRETVVLLNGADWAGPEAGHYVARFDGQDLVPGQQLTFKVRACNTYLDICGAEDPAKDCLRCGYYSNILSLATVPAVPGESGAPTVEAINQTTITVGVGAAAYDGGIAIARYEVRVRTLVSDAIYTACTGCSPPFDWVLTDRRTDLQYELTTRAVNALGDGPWSGVLNVESGAEDLPNRPSGLEVLSDPAVGSRSFSIAWDMPVGNRSEDVLYYELTMTADGVDSERKLYNGDITGGGEDGGWCKSGCTAAISTGVDPATTYTLKIQAKNSLGAGLVSYAALSFMTLSDVPDRVAALQLNGASPTSVDVSWAAPTTNGAVITKYRIHTCVRYYADNSLGECVFEDVSPDPTTALVNALPSGKNYSLSMEVFNAQGSGGNSTTALEFTTLSAPMRGYPPVKQSALPGLSEKTTIRVAWTAPFSNGRPITVFNLSIDGRIFVEVLPNRGAALEYTAGLEQVGFYPGTEHTFRVQAINELGGGAFSKVLTASMNDDVPGTPPPPVAIDVATASILIEVIPAPYSGGGAITHYELQLGHESDRVVTVPLAEAMTYTVSQRKLGTTYVFRSCAVGSLGASAWSDNLVVNSITTEYPNSPTDVEVYAVESRRFTVNWTMPDDSKSDNILEFRLIIMHGSGEIFADGNAARYKSLEGQDCRLGCLALIDAMLFPEITPKTRYNLTMQAKNSYGDSVASASVETQTLADAPDRSDSVSVTDVGESSLTVSWALPADNGDAISSFAIYACEVTWSEEGNEQGACVVTSAAGPSSTSKTVEGLPSGRNYTVLVDVANAEGSSGNTSSAAAVTTLAVPLRGHVPYLPTRLQGLDYSTTVHIVWDAPFANGVAITNYTLEVDGGTVTLIADNERPQYSQTGLVPATAHTFRVRAVNTIGAGGWSEVVSLGTDKAMPGQPPAPVVLGATDTGISIGVTPAPYDGGESILCAHCARTAQTPHTLARDSNKLWTLNSASHAQVGVALQTTSCNWATRPTRWCR